MNSLINQDLPKEEYEILVMNDGSTDASVEVVQEYIKVYENIHLYHQENGGLFKTRNTLLNLAKGDYIYNIDADDYIVQNTLKVILDVAIKNNLDILGFNSENTREEKLYNSKTLELNKGVLVSHGRSFIANNQIANITCWWYFLKREFIESNNITFDENNPMGDGPFTIKTILKARRIAHLEYDVHRYLKVPNSIMNNKSQNHLLKMIGYYVDLIKRYNNIITDLSEQNNDDKVNIINTVKHWRDVNTYVMFYNLIISNISLKDINNILKDFEAIDAFPINHFIGEKYFSRKHKLVVYLFNNKYLFYSSLFPLRVLNSLKLIRLA